MLLDHIGIIGWDEIEPLILSSILSNLSILLIGDIGSNKTEGSRLIAKAILKQKIQFRNYEVPTLNFDDLIGYIDPKSLSNGHLKFVSTPLSIWNADAVLLDEINRANPFIQSKLHELIRTKKLMGIKTALKIVFSAVNPPEKYQSGYLDIALASRFVCIQVPNIEDMNDEQIDGILSNNGNGAGRYDLKSMLRKAKQYQLRDEDINIAQQMCKKIVNELPDKDIMFNARQLKMMVKLVINGLRLRYATNLDIFSNTDTNTAYITSCIPEINSVVRSNVDYGMIKGTIRSIVSGFTLGDPIIIARNIEELCDAEIKDSLGWVTAMKQMIEKENKIESLKRTVSKIKKLYGEEVIEKELADKLMRQLLTKIITKILIKENFMINRLPERINEIASSLTMKGDTNERENI